MPWKEVTMEKERERFVKMVQEKRGSISSLCREFGIARTTGYKWLERYESEKSLKNHSRAPLHRPLKTPAIVEDNIIAYRKRYPDIGALKIREMMETERYENLPSAKTFNNIFNRHHLISKEASQAATPCNRFEKAYPNEMWQADFKGNFALKDGNRCHPLNIIDDHSRFNLCCDAHLSETFEDIQPSMIRIFQEYGLPDTLLCDNGNPWGTSQSTGFTRFEVWLMELRVLTIHGRIKHPQTQGKEERFNGSFKREYLKHHEFENQYDAQRGFDEYRDFYNNKRPHHALNLKTPASRYHSSERKYPERIETWEYSSEYTVHRIKSTGFLTLKGQGYFLSEAFGGKEIAIRESGLLGQYTLVYRDFKIARIDPDNRVFTMKKAHRIKGDPRD